MNGKRVQLLCWVLLPLLAHALPQGVYLASGEVVSPCNQTDSTVSCECKKGNAGACDILRQTDP